MIKIFVVSIPAYPFHNLPMYLMAKSLHPHWSAGHSCNRPCIPLASLFHTKPSCQHLKNVFEKTFTKLPTSSPFLLRDVAVSIISNNVIFIYCSLALGIICSIFTQYLPFGLLLLYVCSYHKSSFLPIVTVQWFQGVQRMQGVFL